MALLLLLAQIATAATLYVDNANAGCSDATITRATNNASNPFCLTNTTAFMQAQAGDVILVAAGDEPYWQTLAAGYNLNGIAANVIMIAQEGANFTSAYTDFRGSNSYWKNEQNVSDGSKIWNSTRISTGSTYVACFYEPLQIALTYAPAKANLTQTSPYFPNWSSFWTTSTTPDELRLKLPADINPNDGGFYCGKNSPIFDITNVVNFTITGGYYIVVQYLVSNGSGVNGLLINDTIITGGVNDNGVIRIENADRIQVRNNEIVKTDNEQFGVWWNLVKQATSNTETSAVKFQDCRDCDVTNNVIAGYFNGVYVTGTSAGASSGNVITGNDISSIMDDCLELENFVESEQVTYNNCTASFVGLSVTPANSSTGYSNVSFNIFDINRSILYNSPTHTTSGATIKSYEIANDFFIHNNFFAWQGQKCNGAYANFQNTRFYNNIRLSDDNRAFDCTGLASYNVTYDYEIINRTDGGAIARYVNSITNSTEVTTLAQLQAIYTGWNVNTTQTDLNLTDGYTPQGLACAIGQNGFYIGAVACSYSPAAPVTPSTSTNVTASCKDAVYSSYKGFGTSTGALTLLFVILIGGVIFAIILSMENTGGMGYGSGMGGMDAVGVILVIAVAGLVLVFVSVFIGAIAGLTPLC